MEKDKEKDHHKTMSGTAINPVITTEEVFASPSNKEDSGHHKSVANVEKHPPSPGTASGLNSMVPAAGAKPANFFELLAAAFSASKTDTRKGPDFIDYLRKSGIKMAWVRAIVALYEEKNKPDDPLGYIVKLMGLGIPETIDVKRMQDQVARLRVKLNNLQAENAQLREAVEAEEEALHNKEEFVSLFDESKFFSEYNSDDDYSDAEEMQQQHKGKKEDNS